MREEHSHWTWRDLSSSQTLFIWWIHLLERFERFQMVARHGIISTVISAGCSRSDIQFSAHVFVVVFVCILFVCVLYNLRIAQVTGGSTVGVVMSASCTLSQGQFGLPMPLTPPKQAVSANPPPSPSNPRQSWANPKLIQGHSQLGVSHRAMPGHHRHNEQPRYAMILQ